MGWGSNPQFRISSGELNFARCRAIHENKRYRHRGYTDANISTASPGQSNYWIVARHATNPTTVKIEPCYSLLMYRTYIHTWWEDGTYSSIDYNSAITRQVLSMFGPVRVWSDSKSPFLCTARFGNRAKNYPYDGGIVVDPDGWIHDVTDQKYRLRPGARKERAEIRKHFRDRAVPRILLGEFGDVFAAYRQNIDKGFGRWESGWMAQIPAVHSNIAKGLMQGASSEDMAKLIEQCKSFRDGPTRDTKDAAMLVAIDAMAHDLLGWGEWYERYDIPYGNINVREL